MKSSNAFPLRLALFGCGLLALVACSSHKKAARRQTMVTQTSAPVSAATAPSLGGASRDVGIVSIFRLLGTPEAFNRATVTVEGYAVLEAGAQYLFSSPDLAYSKYNGIRLEKRIDNLPSEEKPTRFYHVMVTGVFEAAPRPTLRDITLFDIRGEKAAGEAEESEQEDWVAYGGAGKDPDTGYEIIEGPRTSGWMLQFAPGRPHDVAKANRIPMTLVAMSSTEYRALILPEQGGEKEISIRFLEESDPFKRRAMIQSTNPPTVPQEYVFHRRL